MFYSALLISLLFVGSVMPVSIIEGVNEEQIEALSNSITIPDQPTVVDWVIFPFAAIYDLLNKLVILLTVSAVHQILGLVITPFTIGMAMVVVMVIRGS